jgi:hypothetical protein
VVLLFRVSFVGAQERAAFWREHVPSLYVTPQRPHFTRDGKSDNCEYAWFVWDDDPPRPLVWLSTENPDRKKHKRRKKSSSLVAVPVDGPLAPFD